MGKFIITEEEKYHIKGLYEQSTGTEVRLKDLEKQGYSITPGTMPPTQKLKDINFEVYAMTDSAARMDLMKKLRDANIPSDSKSGMIFTKTEGEGIKMKWIQFVK